MAITLDDIKKMPPKRKGLIILVFFLLLGGIDYSLFLQSSIEKKGTLETKLSEIQMQVTEKERLAAQKEKYVREVNALKETLRIALTKLPDHVRYRVSYMPLRRREKIPASILSCSNQNNLKRNPL